MNDSERITKLEEEMAELSKAVLELVTRQNKQFEGMNKMIGILETCGKNIDMIYQCIGGVKKSDNDTDEVSDTDSSESSNE